MNFFQKFFTKKTVKDEILQPLKTDTFIPERKENLFCCHHCNTKFEVDTKKLFPTSVKSCDGFYTYQGIGISCPKCFKDSIYS